MELTSRPKALRILFLKSRIEPEFTGRRRLLGGFRTISRSGLQEQQEMIAELEDVDALPTKIIIAVFSQKLAAGLEESLT
jgi:hypothetical protein